MIDFGSIIFARCGGDRQSIAWDSNLLLRPSPETGSVYRGEGPFDIYRDLIAGLYEPKVSERQAQRFAVNANRAVVNGVAIAQGQWGGHQIHRSQQHVRTSDAGFVRVLYREEGFSINRIGDEVIIHNGPTIILADQGRAYTTVTTDFRSTQIYLSYDQVGYDPSRHPPMVSVPADSTRGRILSHFIKNVCLELLTAQPSDAQPIIDGAAAFIQAVMLSDVSDLGRVSFRRARSAAMRAYLKDNITNPGLGLSDLLANFGASRATIFRDFEPYGGIANFILETRLKAVASDLIDRKAKPGIVKQLSDDYGFSSPQYFSRVFRERTGLLPSDLIGAGGAAG